MKSKFLIATLALITTLLSATPVVAAPHGLNGNEWLAEIDQAFAGVKGFSAVIVHEDGFVHQRAGGTAGPGLGMSWNTYGNIGSAQKMSATLLFMRLIEDKFGRGNYIQINNELNKPVYLYMPAAIKAITPAQNKQITFRDLLRHKSGIRTEHASGNPFVDFVQPITPGNYGVRSYSNTNMKLLTYLSVAYGAPHIVTQTNQKVSQFGWSPLSSNIPQFIGAYYWGMMQVRLFDKATSDVFASCWLSDHIIEFLDAPFARMYWNKNDAASSGGWYDGGVAAGHCKGQGGWYYSTRTLARLYKDLGTHSGVISPVAYSMMYDYDGSWSSRNNRLGWNKQIASPKLQSTFGWVSSPYHGGSHTISFNGHSVTAKAAVIRLPGGYHAIGIVNSKEMSSNQIANALKNAFARSIP